VDSGARNADHILTNTLLPDMSREILSRMAAGEHLAQVAVKVDGEGFAFDIG
jgi:type VI secretion system protein VasG